MTIKMWLAMTKSGEVIEIHHLEETVSRVSGQYLGDASEHWLTNREIQTWAARGRTPCVLKRFASRDPKDDSMELDTGLTLRLNPGGYMRDMACVDEFYGFYRRDPIVYLLDEQGNVIRNIASN